MPTQITLATDGFARADADPLSGNWHTTDFHNLKIASGQVQTSLIILQGGGEIYNGVTWPANQWSQITVFVNGTSQEGGVLLRQSTPPAALNGYFIYAQQTLGGVSVNKFVNGVFTNLATLTTTFNTGDTFYASIIGATITVKQNGTVIGTVTDSSVVSGSAGIYAQSDAGISPALNNWAGGSFLGITLTPIIDGFKLFSSMRVESPLTAVMGTNLGTKILG